MPSFFSFNALISQRASGYKSTTHALAEIIDNSFDANATEVKVIFLETQDSGRKHIAEILICDNGDGMSADTLQGALQFGNTTNTDIEAMVAAKKKGKFGYGLPNASLSQSPCVHVYSWQTSKGINSTYLDLNELELDQSIDIPTVAVKPLPKHYDGLEAILDKDKGTIVAWLRCDRLSSSRSDTIIKKSSALLGRLFRYSLGQSKKITFHQYRYDSSKARYVKSDTPFIVVPNDPLFLMSDTQIAENLWKEANVSNSVQAEYYKKYSVDSSHCKPTNSKFEDHCYPFTFEWRGKSYKFEISTSIADLDIQKPGMRDGGNIGAFYGNKAKEGNISFVRADREIATGHFGFYAVTEPRHRWWSIEIKFNADADDLLGVHNNKQGIEFVATPKIDLDDEWNPFTAELLQAKEKLWNLLTIKIDEAIKKVFAKVKKQHKEWDLRNAPANGGVDNPEGPSLPGGTVTTQTIIKSTDGERTGQFTPEQKSQLAVRLQQRFPEVPENSIKVAIDNYDKSRVRGCVIYAESESESLWSFSTVFDFFIITINTRHEFYQTILHQLKMAQQEEALSAIELFISSLSWEEHTHFRDDHERNVLENFRTYTGMHLNRYIQKLKVDEATFMCKKVNTDEDSEDE